MKLRKLYMFRVTYPGRQDASQDIFCEWADEYDRSLVRDLKEHGVTQFPISSVKYSIWGAGPRAKVRRFDA